MLDCLPPPHQTHYSIRILPLCRYPFGRAFLLVLVHPFGLQQDASIGLDQGFVLGQTPPWSIRLVVKLKEMVQLCRARS